MNTQDAINILDQATQPQALGKITRQGYCEIQQALALLNAKATKTDQTEKEAAALADTGLLEEDKK